MKNFFLFIIIISISTAPGFILSTGNVGEFLTKNLEEVNTYFSKDGGIHWKELIKGSTIYEFGDYGNIMIFAPFGVETTKI